MKMFDCATPLTAQTAANFKASGYDGVCRYLVPASSAWKALTRTEADIIQAAGMKIVSVFETTADRPLDGYNAGVSDANTAIECAGQVGQPTGSGIYFAADFQPTQEQLAGPMSEYFLGIKDTLKTYDVGGYGSYDTVTFLKSKGLITLQWQTYAWSGGMLADCQIFQYKNAPDGADYDLDRGFGFEGAWGSGALTATTTPTAKLDPGVAFTWINTWGKPSYAATNDQGQKNYIRWLSNQLREAAGIPPDADA